MLSDFIKRISALALSAAMLLSVATACVAADATSDELENREQDSEPVPISAVEEPESDDVLSGDGENGIGDDIVIAPPVHEVNLVGADGHHVSYVKGYGDGGFHPEDTLTRGQAAELLYRLIEDPGTERVPFADVSPRAWYYDSLGYLAYLGVVDYSGDSVGPNDDMSRAEFTAMLTRLIRDAKVIKEPIDFTDVPDDHRYAFEIDLASSYGWVEGGGNGAFKPDESVSRAEAVTMINRARGAVPDREFMKDMVWSRFSDVFATNWAYYDIMEATLDHTHVGGDSSAAWEEADVDALKKDPGLYFVGLDYYYIDSETGMPVANTTKGGLTFGPDGKYTSGDAALDGYVKDALRSVVKEGMTREEKLRAAYNYTRDSFKYLKRNYYEVGDTSWAVKEATTMFTTKRGNCYCYASVFYFLAKQLGYDAVLISGKVNNNNPVPHGWVEIAENGEYFMYDPELEMSYRVKGDYHYNFFHMAYNKTPWRYWR